jgi:hypothetical protein
MATLLGAVILILIGVIIVSLRQIWIMQFPWGDNRIKDVTQLNIPLFEGAQEITQRLENLGFEPLGVAKVWLFWRHNHPAFVWYYVNDSKTIYAEISEHKSRTDNALVGLFSWFPDDALVENFYPIGENISTLNYYSHFVKEDLEGGYAYHQEIIQRWSNIHGAPILIQNMAHLTSYETVDRKLHRQRRYRRLTIYLMLFIALSLVSIFILMRTLDTESSVGVGTDIYQMAYGLATHTTFMLVCFGVMAVLVYRLQHPSGALDARRKHKKTNDQLL